MGIIIAILLFSFIVIFHEMGHFLIAKANGIEVEEFALGMGPLLFSKEYKGTRYCLRLLPIGGCLLYTSGALEVDKQGNVNAHRGPGAFAGIGGFANITAKTPTVVFCMTFNAKGLEVAQKKGVVTIEKEGSVPKFVDKVNSVSFSAKRAIENGQKVLYVTERCVFRLTPKGLKLIEVYPGVDQQKDILDLLPFDVEI